MLSVKGLINFFKKKQVIGFYDYRYSSITKEKNLGKLIWSKDRQRFKTNAFSSLPSLNCCEATEKRCSINYLEVEASCDRSERSKFKIFFSKESNLHMLIYFKLYKLEMKWLLTSMPNCTIICFAQIDPVIYKEL